MSSAHKIHSKNAGISAVRSLNTTPERRLRSELWAAGVRFRKHYPVGSTRVDCAIPAKRIAIMVDGCFWHGCPVHYRLPPTNRPFWQKKLETNTNRDLRQDAELRALGWRILRVWECEVHADCKTLVKRILQIVKGSGPVLGGRSVLVDAQTIQLWGRESIVYRIQHLVEGRLRQTDFRVVSRQLPAMVVVPRMNQDAVNQE